jgi:hypothetical protein
MPDPFTIRIFVPDGNPDGVRLIDRMNWTGQGIVFPREVWQEAKKRPELDRIGVYILVGYENEEDDLPTLYIGQTDGLRGRLDTHTKKKDFWDWAIAFTSTNNGLNRAHITWLEYALIEQANMVGRCKLENAVTHQEPMLSESEKADTHGFLRELYQIMPLVGLRVFEKPKAIIADGPPSQTLTTSGSPDTVVVPAKEDGFQDVFLGENAWYSIRISGGMRPKLKHIAAYRSAPISAVTHVAPIDHIEPYGDGGKYKVVFSEPAVELDKAIPFANSPSGSMQGLRYTTHAKLITAKSIAELF